MNDWTFVSQKGTHKALLINFCVCTTFLFECFWQISVKNSMLCNIILFQFHTWEIHFYTHSRIKKIIIKKSEWKIIYFFVVVHFSSVVFFFFFGNLIIFVGWLLAQCPVEKCVDVILFPILKQLLLLLYYYYFVWWFFGYFSEIISSKVWVICKSLCCAPFLSFANLTYCY